jgi:predicted house-cleaning NTP pyrophosphatase (Maf/HAM1 superfamily)
VNDLGVMCAGVVLVTRKAGSDDPVLVEFSETTKVRFAPLSGEEIAAYIATGDCWGKAGSYGIQKEAGAFVEYIDGCDSPSSLCICLS